MCFYVYFFLRYISLPETSGIVTMSVISVIADVIDEIHAAERALNPGDIPDRLVFKHVKFLWQLLLGIDESEFDSHNYEYFELEIEESVFTGLTYFGNDLTMVAENVDNAVGTAVESQKVVQLLDEEDTENTQETSVSFKLSLLNRIRYILFQHHILLDGLFDEAALESVIVSHIHDDILNTTNQLLVSLSSNNPVFNLCYKECLAELLSKENYTIENTAANIVNLYKHRAGVAYFFNSKLVLKFHNQMISLLTHVFRKHPETIDEITEFFTHYPIFPILKPVYRNLFLNTITSEVRDEIKGLEELNDDKDLIKKLNINLLLEVLEKVTKSSDQNFDEELPVTMKWLPQIITYYCDSLKNDGIYDIENDLYITMIKKVAIRWIENIIDTKSFISQLCDLSLIPTAMPYVCQGVQFPTVHMRMALFTVKENIRLCETSFDVWKNKTFHNIQLNEKYEQWYSHIKKTYLLKWKNKTKYYQNVEYMDISPIDVIKKSKYFIIWKENYGIFQNNNKIANMKSVSLYINYWRRQLGIFNKQREKADAFYRRKLLMKYLTLWISAKMCRYSDLLKKFNDKKRLMYFQFWKSTINKNKIDSIKAENFTSMKYKMKFFIKWKNAASAPLAKLKIMETLSTRPTLKTYFNKWKLNIKLLDAEKIFGVQYNNLIIKRFYSKWYKLKTLVDLEQQFLMKSNQGFLLLYFKTWNNTYHMNEKANSFYTVNIGQRFFKQWKLKVAEIKTNDQFQSFPLRNILKVWRLKTIYVQYSNKQNEDILRKTFVSWFEKSSSLVERLEDCEGVYPVFKTATFFDFWKQLVGKHKEIDLMSEKFKGDKRQLKNTLVVKAAFESLKERHRKIQIINEELNKLEDVFKKQIKKKYLTKFRIKKQSFDLNLQHAVRFYDTSIESKYFEHWLLLFDRVASFEELLLSKQDTDNVHLLMQIMSRLRLKMIKVQTDLLNANKFKKRWDRIKTKTFFDLWKLKQTSRNSPTPTARAGINTSKNTIDNDFHLIPELNPYIDLAPRDRGSPEYRPPYRSRMQSVLTGGVSQYRIEQQLDTGDADQTRTSPFGSGDNLTPAKFRTPMIRKTSSRILNSSNTQAVGLETSSIFTSAERVRKKNLEERVSRYRLLRSPPKTSGYSLESVKESNSEDRFLNDSRIFDSTSEITNSSTPIKRNGTVNI